MNRILACIDASGYAASVLTLAAWSARRLSASIELLHVIQRKDAAGARRDLSGAIGLGVKSELLEELTRIDEAESRRAVEHGRVLLAGAREALCGEGVAVETLHRHGSIVETIVEREAYADLVVIGKRGASGAFATDHIGSKVERVVRASNKPVLIASREVRDPTEVVVAFDGSAAATRAVRFVAGSPLFAGLGLHLVMAGPEDAGHRKRLDAAAALFTNAKPSAHLLEGRADKAIGGFMLGHAGAMLVMGAYGHSPLRTLIVGSTTTTMIRTVHAPVLLVR